MKSVHLSVITGLWKHNGRQCNHNPDELAKCLVILPRGFEFRSGRSDCLEHEEQPYMATKVEEAPCATCNGTTTLKYFHDNFGATPRETVALMG